MIVVDTGPLVALLNADDRHRERCRTWLAANDEPLAVPVPVVTETCYFIERDSGPEVEADFLASFPARRHVRDDRPPPRRLDPSHRPHPHLRRSPSRRRRRSSSSCHRKARRDSDRHARPSPLHRRQTIAHPELRAAPMTGEGPTRAAGPRLRIGYCQKHASARFRPLVPADRHRARRFCASEPVDYNPSATPATDGSINRYYDPGTGQFLSVDPLVDQTGLPYGYTGGNPVNYTDASGTSAGFTGPAVTERILLCENSPRLTICQSGVTTGELLVALGLVAGAVALATGVGELGVAAYAAFGSETVLGIEAESAADILATVAKASGSVATAADFYPCISGHQVVSGACIGAVVNGLATSLALPGRVTAQGISALVGVLRSSGIAVGAGAEALDFLASTGAFDRNVPITCPT
ncbi:MAG: hypothetical protein JWO62_1356 [Acidimicrobiaceae bacterium]|nr:hypothetical protein [Acidimicrobiaceae bacterium]